MPECKRCGANNGSFRCWICQHEYLCSICASYRLAECRKCKKYACGKCRDQCSQCDPWNKWTCELCYDFGCKPRCVIPDCPVHPCRRCIKFCFCPEKQPLCMDHKDHACGTTDCIKRTTMFIFIQGCQQRKKAPNKSASPKI